MRRLGMALLVAALASAPASAQSPQPFADAAMARPANDDEQRVWDMGDEFDVMLRKSGRLLDDGPVQSYVQEVSDRLLADGQALNDQQTMARLELVILKTLKDPDKTHRADLWRNLGIIHYHQQKYKQAEHDLQSANELNPKNARTHFYLACLFAHKGRIYEKSGKARAAQQQYKRAGIEIGLARKLEPSNTLYKQDPKQIIQQENGK